MIVSTVVATGISLTIFYGYFQLRALRRNIAEAKQSGLPYVVSPIYFQTIWWMILQEPLLPLLRQLPRSWTESWLPYSIPNHRFRAQLIVFLSLSLFGQIWHEGYEPFAQQGSDTIIVVSTNGNILWTCDPETILQFTKRHHDFLKPVKMMAMLNMYGPTITATEGEESRLYRRIASPSFNERTHGAAWTESLHQTASMLKKWKSMEGLVEQLNEDMATLTLHVISYVCFGRIIQWAENAGYQEALPDGHKMSYRDAITSMLDNTGVLFMTPQLVLDLSPLKIHKDANASFVEWRKYMEEMRDETKEKLEREPLKKDASLLETFVDAGQDTPIYSNTTISPAAVLGNIFIFIFAGHETSANTLTYAITLLACRPDFQKELQADLDKILENRSPSQWSSDIDFPNVLSGHVGALMNETLRLYTVLPFIPKCTESTPQSLTINDRNYTIPANTLIMINTSATHRNPKYWPATVSTAEDGPPYPVSSFNPSHWLQSSQTRGAQETPFTPQPGSYIPFADGPRACIGKRFAQAQFCAVIATIFKDYSIELAVDSSGPSPNQIEGRSRWESARRRAEQKLSTGVGFLASLKMKEMVPLRLVKRGEEQRRF